MQGEVQTCDGQRIKPGLDAASIVWIEKRARSSSRPVSVAWLEAPEGSATAAGGERRLLQLAADREEFRVWIKKGRATRCGTASRHGDLSTVGGITYPLLARAIAR